MQTALHIHALVAQLNREMVGGVIVDTAFYRKERAAYLFIKKDKERLAFGFLFHPAGSGTFLVPASKLAIETNEKPWPFFELTGGVIQSIITPGLDRIFTIEVRVGEIVRKIIVEAIGPNGNLWFLNEENTILATLRHRDGTIGTQYSMSQSDKLNPFSITESELRLRMEQLPDLPLSLFLEKQIIGWNKTLSHEVITRANIENQLVKEFSASHRETILKTISDIANRFNDWENGCLYTSPRGAEVYPLKLASRTDQPEKFKTLSLAVMEMLTRRQSQVEEEDESKQVIDSVVKAIKRIEGRLVKLEKDKLEAADFERYKTFGDLLQNHFAQLKRGMSQITVDDNITGSGKVNIPLDSAITPRDNIEAYFKKHRKGREGLELIERRIELSHAELEELHKIATALETNFESARLRYAEELASLLPREKVAGSNIVAGERLPYREMTLSTGLKIFVGRDGSDNDRTTFEFAKPHELWFHTAQCPGSHVVMKFPNKSFVPSKREIEETASIAAWHSKARNDSLVPVSYTEKRYVRKPRKAKPGLVTIEREKSVMVVPKKPE